MAGVHVSQYNNWYSRAFAEYLKRSKRVQAVTTFLREHQHDYGLSKATSCISVGPGPGHIDCVLLRDVLPQCSEYFAVEPNEDYARDLKQNMATVCPTLKAEVTQCYAQDWAGPPHKVDVIFLFHVMYFLHWYSVDMTEVFLRRCMTQFLNPGGKIMILILDEDCGYSDIWNIVYDGLDKHMYHQSYITQLMKDMALTESLTEVKITFPVDVKNMNSPLANMWINKEATEKEVQQVAEYAAQKYPTGIQEETNWLTIIST